MYLVWLPVRYRSSRNADTLSMWLRYEPSTPCAGYDMAMSCGVTYDMSRLKPSAVLSRRLSPLTSSRTQSILAPEAAI